MQDLMIPNATTVSAPAKINLSLHVCGKRADGYHLLDSLVCFAGVGDVIKAEPANVISLAITGPFSRGLSDGDDNLVTKAARFLAAHYKCAQGARLTLTKNLPVASGIGGGSSDAAATLLACGKLWGVDPTAITPAELAKLGADVPVCLARTPMRMSGIGEILSPAPPLPAAWLVLVNPMQPLATKGVFASLAGRHTGPAPALPQRFTGLDALIHYLAACTNDLAAPAREVMPLIGDLLAALTHTDGCHLARMSGSGPTCFGLFATESEARAAAHAIAGQHPTWWSVPAPLGLGSL